MGFGWVGAGGACASWEARAAGTHPRGCPEASGGTRRYLGVPQRCLGVLRGIWGCLLAFAAGFYSPLLDYFTPPPRVSVGAWQGGCWCSWGGSGPPRGIPQPGQLLAGGGHCVCKAGAVGMKHVPAGCGTPQPAPEGQGTPNPWGDGPVCPHHPVPTWEASHWTCGSKAPMAGPSHGVQRGAEPLHTQLEPPGMWGPDPATSNCVFLNLGQVCTILGRWFRDAAGKKPCFKLPLEGKQPF